MWPSPRAPRTTARGTSPAKAWGRRRRRDSSRAPLAAIRRARTPPPPVVRDPRPVGHAPECLVDDPHGLAHLLHPHAVAVVDVAVEIDGHTEVDLVVREVRLTPPEVPVHAGSPQHGPGLAECDRVVA